MATYNDFNGVYFTLQALRWYQDIRDTELLVIDNYGCPNTKALVEGWVHGARYLLATEVRGTAAPRDLVFREARGEAVLCCDSHVLLAPGVIRRLKEYYREHPECQICCRDPLCTTISRRYPRTLTPSGGARCGGFGQPIPGGKIRRENRSRYPCKAWGPSVAGRLPGPASTRCFGASGGKKATSMKSSDGRADGASACPGFDGRIASAGLPVSSTLLPSTRNSGITSSGTPSSGWIPPPC